MRAIQMIRALKRCRMVVICLCLLTLVPLYLSRGGLSYFQVVSDSYVQKLQSQIFGLGRGCKANHSRESADLLISIFRQKHGPDDSPYHLDDDVTYDTFIKRLRVGRIKGDTISKYFTIEGSAPWQRFQRNINQHFLYDPEDGTTLTDLLQYLNKRTITHAECNPLSSQLVLIFTFDDGGQGVFKPMRNPRDYETKPDHFFFSDIERHTAEIAAFHLDKLLAYNRVPPTVGRVVNITRDIVQVGDQHIQKTAHRSPAGNFCFIGKCQDYCFHGNALCGSPHLIEGAVMAYLPHRKLNGTSNNVGNPWTRLYSPNSPNTWETDESFCETVVKPDTKFQGRLLLDIIDMAVLDFLTGNMDRHHFEKFDMFGDDTFILQYDNGRGFGKAKYDCLPCLAPVRQCCKIRLSTLAKLFKLYNGPDSLSQLLRTSLSSDPLAPILTEPHLDALDRRVGLVISTVYDCVNRTGSWDEVIVDDGVR
ncbi:extracellular serine/threonine protein CG31145-like [Physella acuta]|uniref:extracellular serine/threonine protein CG31145-like n=1 Tax=Physella acuta TaxID=109671 RepID=UPI0027DABEE5|nr:extracellular serine/threonine protein CG31145-like [Physella acuta]